MATVTGLTAARMLEIEAAAIVAAQVNGSGHLILTTYSGDIFDAGDVSSTQTMDVPDFSLTVRKFQSLTHQMY